MLIFNFFRNFFRNFLRRTPVLKTSILLLAPFNAEKRRLGEALVKAVLGEESEEAAFTLTDLKDADGLVEMPLGKRKRKKGSVPLLYSLPGFQEINADADGTRALLGLSSTCQTQTRLEKAFADAVWVVCLDLSITPLPYEALAEDLKLLRKKFPILVGIHTEKWRSWDEESQRTRMQKWREIIGDTDFIECALDTEGISDVLKAVATQPNRHISAHIFN